MSDIHSTAIVEDGAELADGVEVGPYSIIRSTVKIGQNTRIGPHVVIEGHTSIGADCEIFQFASVGAKPQDLKYAGEPSTLEIGDANIVREFVTLQPGTRGGGMKTIIGNNNLFMANAHVGHDSSIGNNNIFANSVALAGHVQVFDNSTLGGLSAVHQFARIGSGSFISGGSMVGQDITPFCFAQGDRCTVRGINAVGLQRAGMNESEISAIKKTYRQLFVASGNLTRKLETVDPDLKSFPQVRLMLDFISSSERGVALGARGES